MRQLVGAGRLSSRLSPLFGQGAPAPDFVILLLFLGRELCLADFDGNLGNRASELEGHLVAFAYRRGGVVAAVQRLVCGSLVVVLPNDSTPLWRGSPSLVSGQAVLSRTEDPVGTDHASHPLAVQIGLEVSVDPCEGQDDSLPGQVLL